MTGFLTDGGKTHIARPVGLAVAKDGALLMADDANGVHLPHRLRGQPSRRTAAAAPVTPPATPMREQAMRGSGVAARDRPRRAASPGAESLRPQSAFADGAPIDKKYSDYSDDVSPPLQWSPGPGCPLVCRVRRGS